MAGWVAGWVVGKSDFNENPVVSLDLDLDFGLRLRVCQHLSQAEVGLSLAISDILTKLIIHHITLGLVDSFKGKTRCGCAQLHLVPVNKSSL